MEFEEVVPAVVVESMSYWVGTSRESVMEVPCGKVA